ncbi:MAG: hypothetical protein CMJ49_07160 [Planctomycetaceae bacterium]|nr:hypothetical protein [Planctomycetaceae bacterium]
MNRTPSTNSELSIDVGRETLGCSLSEPAQRLERPALILNFAGARSMSLAEGPYDIGSRLFVAAGHRVASFDLPFHGDRVEPGHPDSIRGFSAAWVNGRDVFSKFVDDGRKVIDALIGRGVADPGRIFVSGTSRGGYFALRLMAADDRIAGAAAFAPVTD